MHVDADRNPEIVERKHTERVLRIIENSEEISFDKLIDKSGLCKVTVEKFLKNLMHIGKVKEIRENGNKYYSLVKE